ncbi:F-box only protein 27 [Lepisosteus oculatus]|uniref:F-box only protein 27 n=1 Tax=Lepisosteus oculatus TaxID=7918 RepID=UPI00371913CB
MKKSKKSQGKKRRMGQIQHKRHEGLDTFDPETGMDLSVAPEEILVLILSHLPAKTLLSDCQHVCRRWRAIVQSQAFWRFKCQGERNAITFYIRYLPTNFDWRRFYLKQPFNRNLIRNPCGAERLQHWNVHNGGDGWIVRTFDHEDLTGIKSTFVSSYYWCEKSQTIDLLKEGFWEKILDEYQPEITVNDWFSAHRDCGGEYQMFVQLLGANKHKIIKEYTTDLRTIPVLPFQQWDQITYIFRNYGPGVRYVKFKHIGKDILFWKGHYGAWVTNTSVTIRLKSPEK